MIVHEFTLPQIEYYRTFCNFDERESALFELRCKIFHFLNALKFYNMMMLRK